MYRVYIDNAQDIAAAAGGGTVLDLANSDPAAVAIVDGTGTQITSFGGGTQYTEGDVDASITGTAMLLESGGNVLVAAPGTVADGQLVNLGANNDVTVTGNVAVTNGGLTELAAAINASSQMDVNIAASGATVPVSNGGLTELAAAINGSSQMDINIAAQGLAALTVASHAVTNAGTFAVQATAATTGGATPFKSLDIDESEEEVKATGGTLYGFIACNRTTSALYLKFYNNTAAGTTVGTTVPDLTIEIPANASDHTAFVCNFPAQGIAMGTGITVACTTGFADNDSGAPAANACIVNVIYK